MIFFDEAGLTNNLFGIDFVAVEEFSAVNISEDGGSLKDFSPTASVDATYKRNKSLSISLAVTSSSADFAAADFYSTSLTAASERSSVEVAAVADTKEAGATADKGAATPVNSGSVKGVASSVEGSTVTDAK